MKNLFIQVNADFRRVGTHLYIDAEYIMDYGRVEVKFVKVKSVSVENHLFGFCLN